MQFSGAMADTEPLLPKYDWRMGGGAVNHNEENDARTPEAEAKKPGVNVSERLLSLDVMRGFVAEPEVLRGNSFRVQIDRCRHDLCRRRWRLSAGLRGPQPMVSFFSSCFVDPC